ncbi:MAG TPA: peptidoglycan editing factor PgeF [Steroidobacteraceae bacterium]|nr:peptidoglycan editing factor PgeF [Steroidobacteraceae bacterium]
MSRLGPQWLEPDWPAPARIRAISTLRGGGVSTGPYASLNVGSRSGDDAAAVAENRRLLSAAAGVPGDPAWLAQVHGARVIDLDATGQDGPMSGAATRGGLAQAGAGALDVGAGSSEAGAGAPSADASVSGRAGVVCAILTADCMPVLLTSDSGDVVGAAHAGWRGLAGGVLEATVAAMTAKSAAGAACFMAWLGPAIGPGHFEVGAEVLEAMLEGDPGAAVAFRSNARGRYMADLELLARRRLEALGIRRIHGGGRCTFEDGTQYFSHRRDQGRTGRHATLIWLNSGPGSPS